MRITYSPQYNPHASIGYAVAGESVTATIGGVSDTFDFAAIPEGGALEDVQTTLPLVPVLAATRRGGVVDLVLLRWYSDDEDPTLWPTSEEEV